MATSTNHHERSAGSLPESSKPTPLEAPKRRRRYTCPKVTQRTRPKRISAKANHGGRCDYIGPDGNICSHWQAPDSDACWCHFDAYNARSGVEMPYPRATESRSGGWKKKKPTVAVKMIPNELSKPPEWYQRPYQ